MAPSQPENEEESYDHACRPPPFMAKLSKNDHHMAEHVNEIRDHIITDGALSAKVKTLMTLVCDAITAHEDGCPQHRQPCPRIGRHRGRNR